MFLYKKKKTAVTTLNLQSVSKYMEPINMLTIYYPGKELQSVLRFLEVDMIIIYKLKSKCL